MKSPNEMRFENTVAYAKQLDHEDPLKHFRDKFHIPIQPNGEKEYYFCGNSLGLQPKQTREYIEFELDKWQRLGVKGHFTEKFPWMPYHEFLTEQLADLVGAKSTEVIAMNSLTVNLHLMMVSFYRPTKKRYKILIEDHAFPSDHYAVESQLRHHGYDPKESLLTIKPRPGEELLRQEDWESLLEREGDKIALLLLPGVQYFTGQVIDIKRITELGHAHGCMVGVELAHGAGNIPLELHQWEVDFACWCHYKYLNSGAGAVGGCFIHEKHSKKTDLHRFAGWWGHNKATRFKMGNEFQAIPTAEGWQLSNPPIVSLAAIRASLDLISEAGGILPLREKSKKLTGFMQFLLEQELSNHVRIITPLDPSQRGCQLSLMTDSPDIDWGSVFKQLTQKGVTVDWREPNSIRVAPVPLYNSFYDVYQFVNILKKEI